MTQTEEARREELVPFARYRHYEGGLYQILLMAVREDTGEPLVVYQSLDGDQKIYAADVDAFLAKVDPGTHPEAAQRYRFERIGGASEEAAGSKTENGKGQETESESEAERAGDGGRAAEESAERAGDGGRTAEEPAEAPGPECRLAGNPAETARPEENGGNSPEPELDPALERFLDARTTQQRLEILDEMRGRITDGMIDTMAFATGLEIEGGCSPRERFEDLRECLITIQRYETERGRLR